MFDDEAPEKQVAHVVGSPIDTLSIDELENRIASLHQEIERLKQAIAARRITRNAADSVFKF